MNVLFYALVAVVAGVGLASAWISGRDVGYRNAMREHDLLDDNEPTIYRPDNDAGRSIHSCQKPVDLLERIIRTHTNPGDTVCDFFAGSGSTGVAAVHTGRRYILIEREARYQQPGAEWIAAEKNKTKP